MPPFLNFPPLLPRLTVACVSKELRDFVYDHHELWSTIRASTAGDDTPSPFDATLAWASARRKVLHLRACIHESDFCADGLLDPQERVDAKVATLTRSLTSLDRLTSLSIRIDAGNRAKCPASQISALVAACSPSLRQLSVISCDLSEPIDASRLANLTSLALHASAGKVAAPAALPTGLKRLSITGLGGSELPRALASISALESLSLDWASGEVSEEVTPDWSLLSTAQHAQQGQGATAQNSAVHDWTAHLSHLSLGYFAAEAMPAALPPTLRSLELQWNLQTCEQGLKKAPQFDVDAFHASFAALEPLTRLTHLNLNSALGSWGLPPAVLKLTQLESLGVAGNCSSFDVAPGSGRWPERTVKDIAPQLRAFPKLRALDIEILEAAHGWEHLAALPLLEELRLGRSEAAEVYLLPAVKGTIGKGLIRLLPALQHLKEVRTEGMLLPATAVCRRWARLLGFEASELRQEAAAAVEVLHSRGVALERWYSWPFAPGHNI